MRINLLLEARPGPAPERLSRASPLLAGGLVRGVTRRPLPSDLARQGDGPPQNGTELHAPPHLSTQLVFAVRPGDAFVVGGLRAVALPMVAAVSVANEASGAMVTDASGGPPPEGRRTLPSHG